MCLVRYLRGKPCLNTCAVHSEMVRRVLSAYKRTLFPHTCLIIITIVIVKETKEVLAVHSVFDERKKMIVYLP